MMCPHRGVDKFFDGVSTIELQTARIARIEFAVKFSIRKHIVAIISLSFC